MKRPRNWPRPSRRKRRKHIPFDLADVSLDYQILSGPKWGSPQMDVLLVAVKKDRF